MNLTKKQISLLLTCIKSAHEDGSVYGEDISDNAIKAKDAEVEELQELLEQELSDEPSKGRTERLIARRKRLIDHARLKELLRYDPITGFFTYRTSRGQWTRGNRVGFLQQDGYRGIYLAGTKYTEGRLAWFYVYGVWPEIEVRHKNGKRDDSRIENLIEQVSWEMWHSRRAAAGFSSAILAENYEPVENIGGNHD